MKPFTRFATAILVLLAGFTVGNCQTPWTTNGNAPSPNCFIGTTTPSPLVLKTNGMERLAIDANGTLRIAGFASADTAAMVVLPDGSIAKASDPGNGGGDCNLLIWDGDGNASAPDCFIGTTNAQPFRVHTSGIERMRVTPTGNVVVQGVDAKAAFQVYDHMGVTVNRLDLGVTDVHRSIGFNLYQDGAAQYHYQLGTAAKIEYSSAAGLLQLSVAPSQASGAVASFPTGLQIDKTGAIGVGIAPQQGYALGVGGLGMFTQQGNATNFVRVGHSGGNGFLETFGGSSGISLIAPSGMATIRSSANPNNYLAVGYNGSHAVMEVAGGPTARLQVNVQSAKTVEFGGDILVANHIGVGTTNFFEGTREYKLNVNGQIRAKAAHIYPAWADYVFDDGYNLMPLDSVDAFIAQNGHLPGLPSADEVAADGIDIGEMQAKTLEKVEELTLYLLELRDENAALRAELAQLRKEVGK